MSARPLGPSGPVLGAILVLCVASIVTLAHTEQLAANQTKISTKQPQKASPMNDWKRLPAPIRVSGKNQTSKTNSTVSKGGIASKRFQSRMMQTDNLKSINHKQISSRSAEVTYPLSDGWSPHNLVPTFTDQEQGDDMVALASDQDPAEAEFPSLSPHQGDPRASALPEQQNIDQQRLAAGQQDDRKIKDPSGLQPVQNPSSKGRPEQGKAAKQLEELYPDDDDQDELDESGMPGRGMNKATELRDSSIADVTSKGSLNVDKSISSTESIRDLRTEDHFALGENQAGLRNSNMSKVELLVDQKQPLEPERGWLPSLKSGNRQPVKPMKAEGQRYSTAEKLAHLFGGREASGGALSKADVAIEYLKNMLRNRQNSTSSSPPTGDRQVMSTLTPPSPTKTSNANRLSVLANKLNQILNYTAVEQVTTPVVEQSIRLQDEPTKRPRQVEETQLQQQSSFRGMFGLSSDAKFSVGDAKALPLAIENGRQPLEPINKHPQLEQPEIHQANGELTDLTDEYQAGYRLQNQQQFQLGLESQPVPSRQPLDATHHYDMQHSVQRPSRDIPVQAPPPMLMQSAVGPRLNQEYRHIDMSRGQAVLGERDHRPPMNIPQMNIAQSNRFFRMEKLSDVPNLGQPIGQPRPPPTIKTKNHPLVDPQGGVVGHVDSFSGPGPRRPNQGAVKEAIKASPKGDGSSRLRSKVIDERKPESTAKTSVNQRPDGMKDVHNQPPQTTLISSKIYKNEYHIEHPELQPLPQQEVFQRPLQDVEHNFHGPSQQNLKPPKIVSYNYFESPAELGNPGELIATNYQLGDALYSSNGGIEHTLSNGELEAIQNQFITGEHPIVPIHGRDQTKSYPSDAHLPVDFREHHTGSDIKPVDMRLDGLSRHNLNRIRHNDDIMKELASNEDASRSISAPPVHQIPRPIMLDEFRSGDKEHRLNTVFDPSIESDVDGKTKRKSLIVYLNHPRPDDMSKVSSTNGEGYNLAQTVNDQPADSFISAKEFDSHGLSKENKHLDVSNLQEFSDLKEGQDKDGLSVVVIGDAYKYKKIVLLISSKSGGLKFIPMVKDMKK